MRMNKKYEFTDEVKVFNGRTLHRIKRIKDGLIGGWIESEENLSHKDSCFVYDNAMVYDDAKIFGNAKVFGNARVFGDAGICGDVMVFDNAEIFDNSEIYGDVKIYGNAKVFGNAEVFGKARVFGNAEIYDGRITGQISQPYKDIFQHQCKNRGLTAILTEDNEILYSIGCQDNITKEQFLDRIYNKNGGLKENPHRKEYLKLIPSIEQYFKN